MEQQLLAAATPTPFCSIEYTASINMLLKQVVELALVLFVERLAIYMAMILYSTRWPFTGHAARKTLITRNMGPE